MGCLKRKDPRLNLILIDMQKEGKNGSDEQVKLHEALVVFFCPSRWRSWFKKKALVFGPDLHRPFCCQEAIISTQVAILECFLDNGLLVLIQLQACW